MKHDHLRCRQCHSLQQMQQRASRRSFFIPGALPRYAPDRPLKLETLVLDVKVDPRGKTLEGKVSQRLRAIAPDQDRIQLDQSGLKIHRAWIARKPVSFEKSEKHLTVFLEKKLQPGETVELTIEYGLSNPRRGLYFTGPDDVYTTKRYQVWSQGQDEDSRFWYPTLDYPNQKVLTEVLATVPSGFTAISNGALVSRKDVEGGTQFHYRLGTPHVTYLLSLVVGEFSEWSEAGPRDLPIQYFVAKGREDDGKRAFGNTPRMIEAFEKRIGVPYPYEKYSQVAVQDFIFGGMENTSATTQSDMTLHDARAHLDFSSDGLVSHELAHQWFGDLLTCRDWSNSWLNEGFATFFERIWIEEDPGPNGGLDEAKYYSYVDLKDYLEEDRTKYRRPIVCNTFLEPIDLFDAHLYQKGGVVLNLIRSLLGEHQFWKSIELYVSRHRGQNVETLDLIRAIEDATGRNFRRFFDEWVYGAGHPEFELSYQWHPESQVAELVIEQKQTQGTPKSLKDDAVTHLFHLEVSVEMTLESGERVSRRVHIGEPRERVFLAVSSKPVMVRFDPGNTIPKTIKFPRPKAMLLTHLEKDPDCMGRIEAAHELAKIADAEAVQALGAALLRDPFWGVQAEVADCLAQVRSHFARDALVQGLQVRNPKAKKAVIKALGSFRDLAAAAAIRPLIEAEGESYGVEAEAVSSWARAKLPPSPQPDQEEILEVEGLLIRQLEKQSYREVIRGAALRALGELPGIGKGLRPRSLDALMTWSRRGREMDARVAAIGALGDVAGVANVSIQSEIYSLFDYLADEDDFFIQRSLCTALSKAGGGEGIPIAEKIRRLDPDPRIQRMALTVADGLRSSGEAPEIVAELKSALERLEEDHRRLRALVEEKHGGVSGGKE